MSSETAHELLSVFNSHMKRSFSTTFTDSQPDKSIQASPSVNVTLCQPQIWQSTPQEYSYTG